MKKWLSTVALPLMSLLFASTLFAQSAAPDFRINTPTINAIRDAMKVRFAQFRPYLESGVLGVSLKGTLSVRDPAAVPLDQRQTLTRLLTEQERDRNALFREIARANGHPEWEEDIARTFADRMRSRMDKLPRGWWIQDDTGKWRQKE
ncbi:MAG: YdbL family protein [Zoogloeaceae bacterium]|jgi:hypothetical protein|nr:YdbL family protein [Zoogloeaceae bacterium]